jgi:three-Cys-motif partner protein
MPKDNRNFFKTKSRWSEIKDQLLGCYLSPYFQKVLMTGKPLYYVDCFAGKGKFDDGKPGSPIIALQARDACLGRTQRQHCRIDTCFIDLNYANELSANIANFNNNNGKPQVVSGRYEEQIESLLKSRRGNNVFLYIDPYGIKALDSALFDKFESYGFASLEMLINFNSFGFFRDACRAMSVDYKNDEALQDLDDLVEYDPTPVDKTKQSEDLLNSIAGGDYWKRIVTDYKAGKINGYQAEKRLSTEYKQRLRQRYGFVLDMPIRLKAGQRPKYRMIHVCDHEDGCYLMAQNMQKRKDDLFIKVQQNGQLTLLDLMTDASSTIENELVSKDDIAAKLEQHISGFPREVGLKRLLATFVNDQGLLCDFNMIHGILDEMRDSGTIEIIRNPALTQSGNPRTFWEEKKDQTITIRRLGA